jgi:hypothetical protein
MKTLKSSLITTLFIGAMSLFSAPSFAAESLSCKVLPSQSPRAAWPFFSEFKLVVDGEKVTGQYVTADGRSYDLANTKDTEFTAVAWDGKVSLTVDTWLGYDNYIGHVLIENNKGTLQLHESIDCWGEMDGQFEVVCTSSN